jgi:cysteate synthase
MTRHYRLHCPQCAVSFDDDGYILDCAADHSPALLVTDYCHKQFEPQTSQPGIYRYSQWLPVLSQLPAAGSTVTYQSEKLSRVTGLPNLWVAFNGYWPEKGATLETATFKQLEASAVIPRIPLENREVMVVASAGNTAAAFAHACSQAQVPCLIIIPAHGLNRMRFVNPLNPCVKIVSLVGFTDYYDAITLAAKVSEAPGFFSEGGVRNIARRDGLGTTMLSAVEAMGQLPDYYFQAIGSGAGAIAVHESAQRLIEDGRYGGKLPRLMLSQNLPFVPIYLSWTAKSREIIRPSRDEAKRQIREVAASVLSNWQPPYAIKGGVFDVLSESGGEMLVASNAEVYAAVALFQECEGVDIDMAAGVALATLIKSAKEGLIKQEAITVLNITGGGALRREQENKLIQAEPIKQITQDEVLSQKSVEEVIGLFH